MVCQHFVLLWSVLNCPIRVKDKREISSTKVFDRKFVSIIAYVLSYAEYSILNGCLISMTIKVILNSCMPAV